MVGKRTFAGTGIAAAGLAVVAIAAPTGGASLVTHPALQQRSAPRIVELDRYGGNGRTMVAWRSALWLRSDALNRRYHLGKYATP